MSKSITVKNISNRFVTDYAIIFNGSTQYAQAANNGVYDIGTQDFWMAGMFKRTSDSGGEENIAGKLRVSPNIQGYKVLDSGNDRLSAQVWQASTSVTVSPVTTISLNVWYAWGFSVDRDGNAVLYLYNMDTGTLTSDTASLAGVTASITTGETFTVARSAYTSGSFFPGHMDNLIPPQTGQTLTQAQFTEFAQTGRIAGKHPSNKYDFNAQDGTDAIGSNNLTLFATPTFVRNGSPTFSENKARVITL